LLEVIKKGFVSGIKLVIYLFFATQRRHMYTAILILLTRVYWTGLKNVLHQMRYNVKQLDRKVWVIYLIFNINECINL
jgi:hypothetical protein